MLRRGGNGGVVRGKGGCGGRPVVWRWAERRRSCNGVAVVRQAGIVVQSRAMAEAGRRRGMQTQRWPSPSARQRCIPEIPHSATNWTRRKPIKLAKPCAIPAGTGGSRGITSAAGTGPECRGTDGPPPQVRNTHGDGRPTALTARAGGSTDPPLASRGEGSGKDRLRRSTFCLVLKYMRCVLVLVGFC